MPVSVLLAALSLSLLAGASLGVEPAPAPAKAAEPVPEPPELPEPPQLPAGPELPPEPDAVRWVAPVGCPSAADLRHGIERRLGRTLAPGEANVVAQVDPRAEGGYRLVLRTSAAGVVDERTLDADDCRALADATALVVALAIDPVAVAEAMEAFVADDELETPPTETPPVTPTPARRDATTTERRATPGDGASEPSPRRPGGLLRVGAGVGLGALPGVTGVPTLAAGLRWRRARVELEGSYWIPRVSGPVEGARVGVQLGTATVRGCGQLGRDRLEAPLCGGVQLGGMRGQGSGAPAARAATGLWVALEASVGLSWWFRPRWALAGGFAAAVPVRTPSFELTDEPPVSLFEPSAVVGRVWLGIELRLGSP